jgi:putative transposase
MLGVKCPRAAARFCRGHDELRHYLRPRTRRNQHVPALQRRVQFLCRSVTVLGILEAA